MCEKLDVLELFCGIGGMHWALKESGLQYRVVSAIDINTVTNGIYRHNFPSEKLAQREIQSVTTDEIEKMKVNTVLMSPPCQPFTRVGLKKDHEDTRTGAFLSLLTSFEKLKTPIGYMLVENVKGFENSVTRDQLISFLKRNSYAYQELLLTPLQFGIPNSRLRYYCLARHRSTGDFPFSTTSDVIRSVPSSATRILLTKLPYLELDCIIDKNTLENDEKDDVLLTQTIDSIEEITPLSNHLDNDDKSSYILDAKAMKHYEGLDIRRPNSRNSCCFTKRYGHYFVGSGSYMETGLSLDDGRPELRYFTPDEISRLMYFPTEFQFPENVTRKQRYRSLGNSINVYVVANLLRLLVLDNQPNYSTALESSIQESIELKASALIAGFNIDQQIATSAACSILSSLVNIN